MAQANATAGGIAPPASLSAMAFSEADLAHGVTRWMITNFRADLSDAVRSTPFTVPLLCAIACREAGQYWLPLTPRRSAGEILGLCVYDASGDVAGAPRSAFPVNTSAFRLAYGDAFTASLIDEANKARAARGLPAGAMVYKGYGIFQYDLQYVKTDETFFRAKQWYNFSECARRAVGELKKKLEQTGDIHDAVRAYNGSGPKAEQYAADVMRLLPLCEAAADDLSSSPSAPLGGIGPVGVLFAPAATFTVIHGHRYHAAIELTGFEIFASNDVIAEKLISYGFADTTVTGSGGTRQVEATWTGPDTTGQIDSHLSNVVEVPISPHAAIATGGPLTTPAIARMGGMGNISANVFTTESLPEHHEGMLVVRMRPTASGFSSAATFAATEMAYAPPVDFDAPGMAAPTTVGLSALAFYERAGLIKPLIPLRQRRETRLDPAPMSVVSALSFAAPLPGESQTVGGEQFIELASGHDTQQLHDALANDPTVLSVSNVPARYLAVKRPTAAPSSEIGIAATPPNVPLLWNLEKIAWPQARARQSFRDASTIKVAVLDTGVDHTHPNLNVNSYHWQNADISRPVSDQDIIGHGTHVSGTIAALIHAGEPVKGICECALNVWKIFDDQTTPAPAQGAFLYYVNPILYRRALAACLDEGVDVVNLSIGGPAAPDPVEQSLFDQLLADGTTICAAMGNDRQSGNPTSYPAAIPGTVAVGATGLDDRVTVFSNSGNHIAVSAPGKAIWSTLPTYAGQTGFWAATGPGGSTIPGRPMTRETRFDAWDGTSMATPHVAGCAALLIAKNRAISNKLTPRQVRDALMATADKVAAMNGAAFSTDYGAGRINLFNLLE